MSMGKVFILSAPSGAGKTTILTQVMQNLEGLSFSISHTTRPPRHGEVDGVDYYFVSRDKFLEMKSNDDFLESAEVHGNLYGTSRRSVEEQVKQGIDVILDIDVQGADIIRDSDLLEATYIFLSPPGIDELEKRLKGRGLDDDETISRRMENALLELEHVSKFEYLIVNERLDEAIRMFESVILAERAKMRRDMSGKPLTVI